MLAAVIESAPHICQVLFDQRYRSPELIPRWAEGVATFPWLPLFPGWRASFHDRRFAPFLRLQPISLHVLLAWIGVIVRGAPGVDDLPVLADRLEPVLDGVVNRFSEVVKRRLGVHFNPPIEENMAPSPRGARGFADALNELPMRSHDGHLQVRIPAAHMRDSGVQTSPQLGDSAERLRMPAVIARRRSCAKKSAPVAHKQQ
jgi:hypothetical protein